MVSICTLFSPESLKARTAEEALLQRRLRLLHLFMIMSEVVANGEVERLTSMQQEMQKLDQDEEIIWQMVPLAYHFVLSFTVRGEGALLVSQLLEAKERVNRSGNPFVSIRVRQWLALAQVLYQWNRLEEAHGLLQMALHDAAAWQQLDLLGSGYIVLMQVEVARGAWSATQQAMHEVEQLVQRERYGTYPGWLPTVRSLLWLAQGQLREASAWAADLVFPEGAWEGRLYGAFPVVIRAYFARQRWREALELLEGWRGHLDRPANIAITITFLA